MSKPCGIDLGTTFSAISFYDETAGRVVTIELVNHADGAKEIRSIVYYPDGGGVVVGDSAYNAALQYPERVAIGVKRSMGTTWKHSLAGVERSAQEISAEIIKVLVEEASAFLGEKVQEVVITVPAYFEQNERAATEQAGCLAGVNVIGVISEPHAAALAFVAERAADINARDLLVYDLGGGTFDVTLIRTESVPQTASGGPGATGPTVTLDTLRKAGNSFLGGLDWDKALANFVGEKAQQQYGVDVLTDARNLAYLHESCEKAKRSLSRPNIGSVSVVVDLQGHAVDVTLQEFEECTRSLLFQTEALVEQVMVDAIPIFRERATAAGQPDPATIDLAYVKAHVDVMLTGGSTKMPMVESMLRRVMGKDSLRYGNPHLLVSMGAAYWAHLLKSGFILNEVNHGPVANPGGMPPGPQSAPSGTHIVVIEKTRISVGVAVLRETGRNGSGAATYEEFHDIILPKDSRYGASCRKNYEKAADGLTEIQITLYRGESSKLEECELVKTFTINGLAPTGRKGEMIDVTLAYDRSGILRASAKDVATGQSAQVEVSNPF